MKHYNSLIKVVDHFEHLSTYANNRTEAKELIIEAYKGFKEMGYVKDFDYISCWEID
jgi:uncharacterized protein YktA (UPF0223 family)